MDIQILESRIAREKAARIQAESLLEQKSYELYQTNKELSQTACNLQEQSQQIETILEHTIAAIFMVDQNGIIIRANEHSRKLFGAEGATTGKPLTPLFEGDHRATVEYLTQKGGESDELFDLHGLKTDGTPFPIEAAVSKIEVADGFKTVWICRDLSSRMKAEKRRRKLEQELSQAQKMEALGTLASGIAHEINTPIQFVRDNIHFLQDSFEDLESLISEYRKAINSLEAPNKAEILEKLKDAEEDADLEFLQEELPSCGEQSLEGMERIGTIVSAIKEFSHPGQSATADIDLNKAIETTATVTHNQWKYVADLNLDLDSNLPHIKGNAGDINQVMLNLIVNAAHAIEEQKQSSSGAINISTRSSASAVHLEITDTGCGIPEKYLERIYDPFFTTKEVGKGTGQGLAITYKIITQRMGGSIEVETEAGIGTCFKITLPLNAQ
ncbi:PAS domain S-box protein [Kordiimonas sp. SCSIO 12603]|uniref:PAS domain-containing sensor histidine kinase n=1 Tax=Kordiimonas sp. SCSIO 12603 TaxID=2829596 RepID=UPI0021067B7B|nr:ATP-binding protein [Kordiimonas sp. SCSIO 12603]UTW60171.1 PAS domain S-box protein [Kordiimonas sp. SCSIO 12603]